MKVRYNSHTPMKVPKQYTGGMSGIRLLREIPAGGIVGKSSNYTARLCMLEAGKKEAEKAGVFKKILYATWNSIPWRHSLSIAWELGKAMLKSMWSGKLKRRALKLEPNYPELNFTPLENSFTRRPNGMLNWIKDIAEGKPYRLLSDMENGVLLSPKGGVVDEIFPVTMKSMLRNPLTMGILKAERIGQMADIVMEYNKRFGDLEGLCVNELLDALKYVGKHNSIMFYRHGFRDSMLRIAEKEIRSMTKLRWLGGIFNNIKKNYTPVVLAAQNRGSKGAGAWEATLEFATASYVLPGIVDVVDGDCIDGYHRMVNKSKAKLDRLFMAREELAQEIMGTIAPGEFCRSTFYRIAGALGKKLGEMGIMGDAAEITSYGIHEIERRISDAAKRA